MSLTPEQAMQKAVVLYSSANLNQKDFQNPVWMAKAADEISKAQFDVLSYSPACAGQAAPDLNLFATASGVALGTVSAGVGLLSAGATPLIAAATVPVIGAVIAGVSVLVGLINTIFAHHKAAVKRDLAFGCSALPAVNNAFAVVNQAVANGQTSPQAASAALDSIYSNFMSAGGASSPTSIPDSGTAINKHPYCNSNCAMSLILKAMVLYWQSVYDSILPPAQLASAPAGYSATPFTAVLSPALAMASGSPTLAQTMSPSAGYGALIAVVAIIVVALSVASSRKSRQV
jgi:hypothetical protein